MMNVRGLWVAMCCLLVAGCGGDSSREISDANIDFQEKLQIALLDAKPGDVIEIPEGIFAFDRSLSLNIDNVTIRGAGMDKSILTFQNQIAGAEGLLVTASNFTIEDLAIEDTIGDALKVNEGNNIIIRNIRTEWTGGHKKENGAYGIYPVQTTNVLLEGNVAIGASDAGIYVGQSKNVVVRHNRAEFNVAGIEIENTIGADVYENVTTNNTGGILVFNMPHLMQEGHSTRIFNNEIIANNTKNFGHKGTPVASVPSGSGIVINSNDKVEIFANTISDNKTANIIISSLYSANYTDDRDKIKTFDAYPESIYIYGNKLSGGGDAPDHFEIKALKLLKFGISGRLPNILWDGYIDEAKFVDGQMLDSLKICVDKAEVGIINVDAPNAYKNPNTDISDHLCTLPRLPEIQLALAD